MESRWILFFFFFQAEDGIRDKLVTGVQTCALPILDIPAAAITVHRLTDGHSDRVRLFAGGAARTPDTQATRMIARLARLEVRQNLLGQAFAFRLGGTQPPQQIACRTDMPRFQEF